MKQLCLLAKAEGWVAAGRDVVAGTLYGHADEVAVAAGQAFVEEARRERSMTAREAFRLLNSYVGGFLDAIEAFKGA